jgi:hypothetical protein
MNQLLEQNDAFFIPFLPYNTFLGNETSKSSIIPCFITNHTCFDGTIQHRDLYLLAVCCPNSILWPVVEVHRTLTYNIHQMFTMFTVGSMNRYTMHLLHRSKDSLEFGDFPGI